MPHHLHRLSPASCAALSRSLFRQTSVQMFAVQLQRLTLQREPDWAFVAHRSVDQPVTTQFGVGSFFRHWHSLYHLQAPSHGIQLRVRYIPCAEGPTGGGADGAWLVAPGRFSCCKMGTAAKTSPKICCRMSWRVICLHPLKIFAL